MGYSYDGPCLKFTSLFFKDKKFIASSAKDFEKKNANRKYKEIITKYFLFSFFIAKTIRAFIKFNFSKCKS